MLFQCLSNMCSFHQKTEEDTAWIVAGSRACSGNEVEWWAWQSCRQTSPNRVRSCNMIHDCMEKVSAVSENYYLLCLFGWHTCFISWCFGSGAKAKQKKLTMMPGMRAKTLYQLVTIVLHKIASRVLRGWRSNKRNGFRRVFGNFWRIQVEHHILALLLFPLVWLKNPAFLCEGHFGFSQPNESPRFAQWGQWYDAGGLKNDGIWQLQLL